MHMPDSSLGHHVNDRVHNIMFGCLHPCYSSVPLFILLAPRVKPIYIISRDLRLSIVVAEQEASGVVGIIKRRPVFSVQNLLFDLAVA